MAMDYIHSAGIDAIVKVQNALSGNEEFMLLMSRAGDPRNAFLIYFPLVYSLSAFNGRRVMWAAVVSEWLNIVFKWLLFGQRPYWWIHENGHQARQVIQQFPLTCETGPGSPSGHAMVTAAVFYVIAHSFACRLSKWIPYTIMLAALVPVSLARVYIATHFPHQVVAGTICGIIISITLDLYTAIHKWTFVDYLKTAVILFSSCLIFSWTLDHFGIDLHWTLPLANKWCANAKEWVSLDTVPYNSLVRDTSVLAGFGLSQTLANRTFVPSSSWMLQFFQCLLSLLSVNLLEACRFSFDSTLSFYAFSAFKHSLIPFLVVFLVPSLLHMNGHAKVQ